MSMTPDLVEKLVFRDQLAGHLTKYDVPSYQAGIRWLFERHCKMAPEMPEGLLKKVAQQSINNPTIVGKQMLFKVGADFGYSYAKNHISARNEVINEVFSFVELAGNPNTTEADIRKRATDLLRKYNEQV